MVVALLPVVVRNVRVGVEPMALSSVGAVTFIATNGPLQHDDLSFYAGPHVGEVMGKTGGRGWPVVAETLRLHDSAGSYVGLVARKVALWWRWLERPNLVSFAYYREHAWVLWLLPVRFALVAAVAAGGLAGWAAAGMGFGVWGMGYGGKASKRCGGAGDDRCSGPETATSPSSASSPDPRPQTSDPSPSPALLVLAAVVAVHVIGALVAAPHDRYRLPVVAPLAVVAAGGGAARPVRAAGGRGGGGGGGGGRGGGGGARGATAKQSGS